uniref:Zinc finger C2HC-type containing 1C n=1 Tax=Latimeria chalumnae TaxID=7897 RepID=H3BG16_LATCH
KRSAGIDRAHPLRPMCHRKAASLNNIFNPEETGVSRASNSKSRRRSSGFKNIEGLAPSPVHQMQRSVSNHSALEKAWLQEQPKKIQMIEESLEEEIRRKEALIMEKLKRTEEELRRIQKEKERVEEEERKEKERLEKKNVNISEHLDCDPMIRNRNRRDTQSQKSRVHNTDFLARTSYLSHPDEDYQQFNAEKLKKERLLSSNNKIKDRESFFSSEDNQNMEEALSYKTNTPNYSPFISQLTPCSFCGRKFAVDRLSKHAKICKKSQNSKRKVFDSSKARAKGTDLEQYHNRKSKVTSQCKHCPSPKKNTWRQKHESFIRTIRQAREITQQISRGVKPSDLPTLPPEENPDYVPCSHCGRRFAPKVAERHIPKCENIKSRPPAPPQRRR